ncbi:MAG: HAMP domain-containing histidine kinase [Oscillospiraceae bacterium]|nr:HAMP domain-containing histidine kinase [Oscillospiraceae bacterium]
MNKSRSMAGRLTASLQLERLFIWIFCDMLIFLFSVASWCVCAEMIHMGGVYPSVDRTFSCAEGLTGVWNKLGGAYYEFGQYSVPCGAFLHGLLTAIGIVGMVQTLIWTFSFVPVYFKIKKNFDPLNEIAVTTNLIASAKYKGFDDIETAIDKLDPMSDIHISTGNRDLKNLENSINMLLDRMRDSYASQARFVSDASHELRTPIAVIKGYADMLARWGKSDESVLDEGITAIQNESENMNKLIEQLLFIARSDNGRQPMTISEFSLSDLISEICSQAAMIDKDHEYVCDIKDSIDINADVSMIKETIRILSDNAKKYTPSGNKITLRAMMNEENEPCFEVSDTGIGIDSEDVPHIFDRFFRSDPARTRETGGTGLGLSIAKLIVERHGGYFKVVSYKDIGTRITVCLPRSALADEKEKKDENS